MKTPQRCLRDAIAGALKIGTKKGQYYIAPRLKTKVYCTSKVKKTQPRSQSPLQLQQLIDSVRNSTSERPKLSTVRKGDRWGDYVVATKKKGAGRMKYWKKA